MLQVVATLRKHQGSLAYFRVQVTLGQSVQHHLLGGRRMTLTTLGVLFNETSPEELQVSKCRMPGIRYCPNILLVCNNSKARQPVHRLLMGYLVYRLTVLTYIYSSCESR